MKRCEQCGFIGDVDICPNDGTMTVPLTPSTPPPKTMPIGTQASEDDGLRGADFGQWAAPEIQRKGADSLVGQNVGDRYFVRALVGRGGMGAVYEAQQTAVQRTVALKVLLKEYAENESVIRRFHQEALAASRLAHPNTIKVYDFGQADGMLYIAMEFLQGETVAQLLAREGVLPPRRIIGILRQVCKSLAEAHKNGIIHRDLKPENIFLTKMEGEQDFAKVLDFGVAKLRTYEDETGTLTQAGSLFGTPRYMSPEHARSGALDARADLYSLGVIFYELLLGVPPFVSDNPLSVLLSQVHDEIPRFAQHPGGQAIPPAVEAVVFKALAKDREQRYATAEALSTDLEILDTLLETGDLTLADRLPPLPGGLSVGQSLTPPAWTPVIPPEGSGPPRRGTPLGLIAGAAVITIVFTSVILLANQDDERRTRTEVAPSTVTAPTPAPKKALVEAPTPESAKGVFFTLDSSPSRARIIDQASQTDVGTTPHQIEVFAKASFVIKKPGYRDYVVDLDPASAIRALSPKLVPRPKRPAAKPRPIPVVAPPPPTPPPARLEPAPQPKETQAELPMEFN